MDEVEPGVDDGSSIVSASTGNPTAGVLVDSDVVDNGLGIGETVWAWTSRALRPWQWLAADARQLDSDGAGRATTPPPRAPVSLAVRGEAPMALPRRSLASGTARRPLRSGSVPNLLSAPVLLVCTAVALLTSPAAMAAPTHAHGCGVGVNVTAPAAGLPMVATGERDLGAYTVLAAYGLASDVAGRLCRARQDFDDTALAHKLSVPDYVLAFGTGFARGVLVRFARVCAGTSGWPH